MGGEVAGERLERGGAVYAVDVPPATDYDGVCRFLEPHRTAGVLDLERDDLDVEEE